MLSNEAIEHRQQLLHELTLHPQLTMLLDLDGTLIPFAPTAEAAKLDEAGFQLLRALIDAGVRVVIVSGRPRALVDPMRAPLPGAWWVAEHGSWYCDDSGRWTGPGTAPEIEELIHVFEPYTHTPGVRLEPKSQSICVHWRLVPHALKEETISSCELSCDEWLESHPDFERLDGVEMLEVRRRSSNKSRAVSWVRGRDPGARIIAVGDDDTDEDMFHALRSSELSVGVGARRGNSWVSGLPAVREFLGWVIESRTGRTTDPFPGIEFRRAREPTNAELVVVSNRTPPKTTGRNRPVGGLVSALSPALIAHKGVWLGWNGSDSEGDRELTIDDEASPVTASFDFPPDWREHFYGGFCNRALWPLFHSFPSRVQYTDEDWQAYVAANSEFARHTREVVAPDGTVWVHDYHLLLAGQELRRLGFTGPLGMFLHIPFPEPDMFETLPWAGEIVRAMMDFDLVGFHTEQWADNFRRCAKRLCPSRTMPDVGVLPIGVDPASFQADTGEVDRDIAGLQALLGDRRMILGVDRLDYTKGIPNRLLAFERLLDTKPEWRGKVSFVQVSVPSRSDVPEYAELRQRVENLVGRINARFGEAHWMPIRYLYRSYDHRVLTQLYRLADVALVTPLRDGLNLVAKEFVVAQQPASPGVLVLSRFAGAAAELEDAVLTNPFHPDGLAADIDFALRMDPEERQRRHALLAAALGDQTPQAWASAFLDRLASAHRAS